MMNYLNFGNGYGASSMMSAYGFGSGLILVVLWSPFWKGLLLNTAGILEIIYLFAILKLKPAQLFKK
ncbi:MAG: hypothetical protein NT003_00450 [Candidatus Magasanikbacteria bacterium]|nr:hypothetical protein [Candidatus Magasanikbacteria bacterium]